MNKAKLQSEVKEIIESSKFWEPNSIYSLETVSYAIVNLFEKLKIESTLDIEESRSK